MKSYRTFLLTFALAIAVGASTAFPQGLYWEQTVSAPGMGAAKEIRTKGYVKPMKLKSTSDEEGSGVIIRSDKEMIYVVNDKEKTYSEMTFKEFEAQMAQVSEQMKKMEVQMEDMSPEAREMLKGMLGGMSQEKEYSMKKTNEKKKIVGYSCEKVVMYEGEKEIGEFWITKDIGSMKNYAKDWVNLMDKMVQGPMAKMYRQIAELDGFAMESKIGGMRSTTTKLEKRTIPDSEFELPAGYKKVKMQGMEMMRGDEE